MRANTNLLIIVLATSMVSVGFAEQAVTPPQSTASAGDANEVKAVSFPYIARITSDNVNIRSGPGTNYYSCGKLNKDEEIKVVGSQFSWSQIVPPPGSFSWISKQYVSIDPNNPAAGTVTDDSVRVYAGSEELKPMHSTTLQLKLNRGEKVALMGVEQDDYYKIAPPSGAYLWVFNEYVEPIEAVGAVAAIVEPDTEPNVKPVGSVAATTTAKVVLAPSSVEVEKLKEYYALKKQVDAERANPIGEQNYTDAKKALGDIAANKEAGKAGRYSEFAIKQIERYELAQAISKELELQNTQIQQIQEGIDKARQARLADVADLGRFAAIGQLQISNIYGSEPERKHYRIIDESGKTICYALPSGAASGLDLSKFVGLKVGLAGTIEPYKQTAGALVRFTEIVELK